MHSQPENVRDHDRQPVCRTTAGHPCVDGPLVGEFHHQGASLDFEGSRIGLETGTYRLARGKYVWQKALKVFRGT